VVGFLTFKVRSNQEKVKIQHLGLFEDFFVRNQFVAHPHCQQLLASVWYAGIPGWRRYHFVAKFVIIVTLIILLPVMALIYLLVPRSRIGRFVRRPFMKFMYHSASFGVFLFLLIMASTNVGGNGVDQAVRQQQRGPPPTTLEWLIVFYVMGKFMRTAVGGQIARQMGYSGFI
jgi:transient receptor potential cation channel subfamily C protein 4